MKITLKQITVFKAVHVEGQISKAAKQLYMSVPAVSMALKELESNLNSRLFKRTGSGLVLTSQGEMLLPYANNILNAEQQLNQLFVSANSGLNGTLVVGACKTMGNYVLSRLLPVFQQQYPTIQVRLKILDSQVLEQMVAERELEVAFVDSKPTLSSLSQRLWMTDQYHIVCGVDNPIRHETCTAERLSQELWYLDELATATRNRSLKLLGQQQIYPQQEMSMGTLGAIKRAVATGYGLAVLPSLAVAQEIARGELVVLELEQWQIERHYWLIQRYDEPLSSIASNLLIFMQKQLHTPESLSA